MRGLLGSARGSSGGAVLLAFWVAEVWTPLHPAHGLGIPSSQAWKGSAAQLSSVR